MSNVGFMYKVAGLWGLLWKGLKTPIGLTAAITLPIAYSDYVNRKYMALSGMTPEQASQVSFIQKLVRTPPEPGSKVFINTLRA